MQPHDGITLDIDAGHTRISVEPVDEEVARRAIRRLAEEWAGLAPGTVWSESGDAR